jgi:diguanylate cyclase (GGDEF)-like protein/PAS domain S-box-containing protein
VAIKLTPSHFRSNTLQVAVLATVVLIAMMLASPLTGMLGLRGSMLSVHLLMELFAIIIAMLIVTVSWYTFDVKEAQSSNVLICGFLIVAACDILHALTYKGMPPLLTESSTPRAIFFWLMGRSFEVVTMLLVALSWRPPMSRQFWLGTGLIISALLIWIGSYQIEYFPLTFVDGRGVTGFKSYYEYVLCILNVSVAYLFWRQAERSGRRRYYLMALSSFIMGIGEIAFTSYVTPSDFQNIFGHAYKIASYALLFWATFIISIRAPIEAVRLSENELQESKKYNRTLFDSSPVGLALAKMDGTLVDVNYAYAKIIGRTVEEAMGMNYWDVTPTSYFEQEQEQLRQLSEQGRYGPYEKEYIHKDGRLVPVQLSGLIIKRNGEDFIWSSIEDVTLRKKAEEEIRHLAFYDSLTRLPNRRLLMDRLSLALVLSARSRHYGAVLFIDMDNFKLLNDTLGHDFGDLLLIEAAARIQACVRERDSVARLGGDEFVVLLEEVDTEAKAASQKVALIAEKIRASLADIYDLGGHLQHSSPSIGVSLYLGNEKSVDSLLKSADIAMYQAKDAGRNAVRFFDPAMQQAVEARAALETDLRKAIIEQQFQLHFQIQMDSDQQPLGAEALIRWLHPVRGMVPPKQFIAIAEESNLILEIGNWVLHSACQQLSLWRQVEHARHLVLAVNVSAMQFKQSDFVAGVIEVLQQYQVDPTRLKLELTESVVLSDVKDVIEKMYELKALGVGLSMDDFGTGYSSLSYLKQLPLDQIKIDQSFVRDMIADPNDAVMVKTIIDMAHNFRLSVIAEGVETESQMIFLKKMGCTNFQGYYFSKPVPIEAFTELLQRI